MSEIDHKRLAEILGADVSEAEYDWELGGLPTAKVFLDGTSVDYVTKCKTGDDGWIEYMDNPPRVRDGEIPRYTKRGNVTVEFSGYMPSFFGEIEVKSWKPNPRFWQNSNRQSRIEVASNED